MDFKCSFERECGRISWVLESRFRGRGQQWRYIVLRPGEKDVEVEVGAGSMSVQKVGGLGRD